MILLSTLSGVHPAEAAVFRSGQGAVLPATEVITDDLYIAGNTVRVEGDVLTAGQNVVIGGAVGQDMFVAAGTWLGQLALSRMGQTEPSPVLGMLIGVLVIQLLALIPALGGIIGFAALLLGLGAIVVAMTRAARKKPADGSGPQPALEVSAGPSSAV